MPPRGATAAVVVAILGGVSCGYPTFQLDSGGTGGRGAASSSAAQSSSASSGGEGGATGSSAQSGSTTSTATTAAGTGGALGCPLTHPVISEIRSRGINGGNDEFIEIYNPTAAPIPMDDAWSIMVRGSSSMSYSTRWQGPSTNSISIPPHGHFLIAGPSYAQGPAPDVALASSITSDSASVLLVNVGSTVDAVCFAFGGQKPAMVATFECEGTPASNAPHDDTLAGMSDLDTSIARNQDGCADSQNNAIDFSISHPADPQSTKSPPAP
ncbi:MAG: lamin tail domain-containing protein [Byssovorax sp.]